jgi:hypothetical protein
MCRLVSTSYDGNGKRKRIDEKGPAEEQNHVDRISLVVNMKSPGVYIFPRTGVFINMIIIGPVERCGIWGCRHNPRITRGMINTV